MHVPCTGCGKIRKIYWSQMADPKFKTRSATKFELIWSNQKKHLSGGCPSIRCVETGLGGGDLAAPALGFAHARVVLVPQAELKAERTAMEERVRGEMSRRFDVEKQRHVEEVEGMSREWEIERKVGSAREQRGRHV